MFGQNNDNQQAQQPYQNDQNNPPASENNPPASFYNPNMQAQAQPSPATDGTGAPALPTNSDAPMIMDDNPTSFVAPATPADGPVENSSDANQPQATNNDLLGMKQEALQHLTPLVSHLDQSPEEKFRTVMMMIQASDDHSKLGEAFEIAKQITDDKTRAQALLDVINEINYFTQQHSN